LSVLLSGVPYTLPITPFGKAQSVVAEYTEKNEKESGALTIISHLLPVKGFELKTLSVVISF